MFVSLYVSTGMIRHDFIDILIISITLFELIRLLDLAPTQYNCRPLVSLRKETVLWLYASVSHKYLHFS